MRVTAAKRFSVAWAMLAVAGSVAVRAQATGGLTVQVVDETGNLPGATVTISNAERKIKTHTEISHTDGRVSFPVLPPGGGYRIEVSFPGYGTVRLDDLRVKSNSHPTLTVKLLEQYVEHTQVSSRRDVVDIEKSSTSTKFSDDFIQDLPVPGRFYQNILTLAPGVQDANNDGNPNVHGSRARDFRAIVSGVANVDPLTGKFRANVNPNSIEEIEVITAGAGPEYGRAQGGFANIIQKQGSNTFEGVFDFIYRTSELDGDGAARLSERRTPDFEWLQPSVQVSGPIVKDKLWYRLSHEWIDREDPVNVTSSLAVVTTEQQINSDQLTWQVTDRNKLAFKYDANPVDVTNFGVSSLTPPEAAQFRGFEADTWSVVWSAAYSPRVFVESIFAWQDGGFEIRPTTTGLGNSCVEGPKFIEGAQCVNLDNGTTSGSFWLDFQDWRQRWTTRSDATIYAKNRFLGMSHQVKFGLIIENERYVRETLERPRVFFNTFRPPFSGEIRLDPIGIVLLDVSVPPRQQTDARGATWGFYVKDQMKPRDNISIEVGARLEREVIDAEGRQPFDPVAEFEEYNARRQRGESVIDARVATFTAYEEIETLKRQLGIVLGLPPHSFASFFGPVIGQGAFQNRFRRREDLHLVNTNVSPFFALSWDPWSNGRTKIAVTAGRHYNNVPLIIATQELSSASATVQLLAERKGGQWTVGDARQVRGTVNPAASVLVVDRDLSTPYQDELTLAFERELWAETSLSLTWVRRAYRDQFQDIDLNHVPGDFGSCVAVRLPGQSPLDPSGGPDGIVDDCAGEAFPGPPVPLPGGGSRTSVLQRPDGRADLYKMNPFWGSIYQIGNHNEADYDAVVLQIVRRQYRGWELQGSYTWSQAEGNGEDFNQFLGDDRSTLENEEGFQSTDQRHVVKLAATTVTPWGIRLGGTMIWQSGLPYSLLSQKLSLDSMPPQFQNFGSPEPRTRILYPTRVRNDQRNPSYWDFNVKATREFTIRGGLNLQLSAEIYNLLNEGTYIVWNPFQETGFQLNGNNDAYRRFGRRFQMGLRLSF
jgi:hypothetical protein